MRRFLFRTLHDVVLMLDRELAWRQPCPSGGVIDSQAVNAPSADKRGYDAAKKIVGRERHIAVELADGAYDRTTLMDKAATLDFVVEVVCRHEQQAGFAVLPHRWLVERTTFG
ncbi:transposase (fragment) (plasmid) [Ralstonia solanacearum CMR15]